MAKLAWHDNLLACYPALLAQLKSASGVKKVMESTELSALTGERKQLPLDGAVYVVFDGFTPAQTNDRSNAQIMEIGFSVILTKRHYNPTPQTGGVGETITAIAKALQGFEPLDSDGQPLTITPFKQTPALPIQYEDGFAYFPLRFTTEVAIFTDLTRG